MPLRGVRRLGIKKGRSGMNKSTMTRRKIVAAAVQQLAGEDIYHRMDASVIASKAGVSEATVRFYFGKKDDLSQAVWQNIVDERASYTVQSCYATNRKLLATREGQREFIRQMLVTYSSFFQRPQSEPRNRLIRLFFIEHICSKKSPREPIYRYLQEELDTFHQICHEICGIEDRLETSMWFLFFLNPLGASFRHIPLMEIRDGYLETVIAFSEKMLFEKLGLADETKA